MIFSTFKAIAFVAALATATPMAYAQSTTELEEDFSLFTAGSESSPSSAINDATGTIPSSYFHQSGWSGYGVHQAGVRAHSSTPTTTEHSSTHRRAHTSASTR